MGGWSEPQQAIKIIEVTKEVGKWWVPIAGTIITVIGGIIVAMIKRRR